MICTVRLLDQHAIPGELLNPPFRHAEKVCEYGGRNNDS